MTAVDARSESSFARHSHDEFGVGLMTGGGQLSFSGRGQVEAAQGDVISVNPGEIHDGIPMGQARSWSMLYLSPEIVRTIAGDLEEGRASDREMHAPVMRDSRLACLFTSTRQAALRADGEAVLEERLLTLFAGLFRVAPQQRGGPTHRLSTARQSIDDAPNQTHTLVDLAAMAGLSRYQTLRGFARLTGLTPHAYVLQRRLETARDLIQTGESLADAAIEAGFSDQSHMHRTFVTRYGYTPGAYAAALRPASAISSKRYVGRPR